VIEMAEPKQNKNGTWEFVIEAGKKPDGSRHQIRRRGFKGKREAIKEMAKVMNELEDGKFIDPSKVRVIDFMKEWFEERKGNVEPETFERDYGLFKNHIMKSLGNSELQKITPYMMQKLINHFSNDLSSSTVHIIYSLFSQAFKKAMVFKLIKENPITGISLPKKKKSNLQVWDDNTIKSFIENAKNLKIGQRYYIGYVMALLTGMRRGEILGLRWDDVDFENGIVYIRQILSSQTTTIKERTKTEAGNRSISIPQFLIDMLLEQKEKQKSDRLEWGRDYSNLNLVISTPKGKPICPKNFYRTFKEICKRLDLPIIRIHDLRHSHATMLIAQNVNPKIISERLGHNDIGVTLNIYSHVLPSMQKEVADRIDQILKD
jgi:integrase